MEIEEKVSQHRKKQIRLESNPDQSKLIELTLYKRKK